MKQSKIPVDRIILKLDEHLGRNDYQAGERLLLYWIEEAKEASDDRGELTLDNELIGLYRKLGQRENTLKAVSAVIEKVEALDMGSTVSGATSYINAGTAYKAFSMAEKAVPFFEKALDIYKKHLAPDDRRFGGLYNNMGLVFADLKRFDEAEELYEKALEVMKNNQHGGLEQAITYLNMASMQEQRLGLENAQGKIEALLSKAKTLLDSSTNPDEGYYAFVCEKCASTFGYYGYFLYENELKERAEKIYERT